MRDTPTILCVDDEEIVRRSLKEQLKRDFGEEYRIEAVESSESALEVLDELLEDGCDLPLVIADQIMPGQKGDELLIEVHRRLPETLTIMLTGQASVEAVANVVNNGNLYRYIAKPWARDDLSLTVREALRRYFQDRRLEEQNVELRGLNEQLERRADAFFRFVPREFLHLLGAQDDYESIELGMGVDLEMAMMFSDIRGFTTLAESMSPAECVEFINRYLSAVEPAIAKHGGFIEHIAGDGILALFRCGADCSIRAAIDMKSQLRVFNAAQQAANLPAIAAGVGINIGRLTLGTMGSPTRLKCGVVGDPVNLAARVEGLTSVYGAYLLVTQAMMARVDPEAGLHARHVDRVIVKGRSAPVDLMEVLESDEPARIESKLATLPVFEAACAAFYEGHIAEAAALYRRVLAADPLDTHAARFLARCERVEEEGLPADWTGITVYAHK